MGKLPVFYRLVAGNLIVLLLAALVGAYAIWQLGKMRVLTSQVVHIDNQLINLGNDLSNTMLSQVRNEKKYLLLHDQALYAEYQLARSDFQQLLKQTFEYAKTEQAYDILLKIQQLGNQYNELFQQEAVSREKAYTAPQSANVDKAKEQLLNELLAELSGLTALCRQNILQKTAELDETISHTYNFALLLTIIALLAGLLASIAITRSITSPLSLIRRKTDEIAKGVFSDDLRLSAAPEIESLASALNIMCHKLAELDSMKSDFYTLMSHELRTPLTSILEGTNMFLEGVCGEPTEKQKELLVIMTEESRRLIDLVNSLLDLSRFESGMFVMNLQKSSLARLAGQVVNELLPLSLAKNINIKTAFEEMADLEADQEKILQVIRNLLGNAIKFAPENGQISVSISRLSDKVQLTVTDNGPGIPLEKQQFVFEKFGQAGAAKADKKQGSGLGLAIVRQIVKAHGGKVWVESEPEKGSTFIVSLPYC